MEYKHKKNRPAYKDLYNNLHSDIEKRLSRLEETAGSYPGDNSIPKVKSIQHALHNFKYNSKQKMKNLEERIKLQEDFRDEDNQYTHEQLMRLRHEINCIQNRGSMALIIIFFIQVMLGVSYIIKGISSIILWVLYG